MDAITELLKNIDPSRIDEALALLQSLKSNAAPQQPSNSHVPASSSSEACRSSPEPEPQQLAENGGQITELLTESWAEGASELDARKVICDEEKESRRILKDTERDARKAEREAEREARNKAREAEKAALKVPKEAPNSLTLFGFLSSTVKAESNKNRLFSPFVQDKRVAPAALQFWRRPEDKISRNEETSVVNLSSHAMNGGARRDPGKSKSHMVDEESSLLHPPMYCDGGAPSKAKVCVRDFNAMIEASNAQEVPVRDLLRQCGCAFHAAVSDPYASFDNEVVFVGFFAIGYDPCQSRPPYFGTYNHLQEGNLNEAELLQMGRFPLRCGIPRLSNIDYEYDSGDDWDVMEGDEDIAASSSSDSDKDTALDSLDSSDLEFIDDSDSDCDTQRKIMEARQRRLHRLRNKSKLVPSYSGPFVGIPTDEHPLRGFDELERFAPLNAAYFSQLLEKELNAFTSGSAGIPASEDEGLSAEEMEAKRQRALMEAALKNRREMTDTELKALHTIVASNSKVSTKMILAAFKQQQLCVGVARAEIERTIRRFYERRHRSLVLRGEPWSPTDERLFARVSSSKKPKSPGDGGTGVVTGDGEGRNSDENEDADDGTDIDDVAETTVERAAEIADDAFAKASEVGDRTASAPVTPSETVEEAGHPKPSPHSSGEAKVETWLAKTTQITLTKLSPKESASASFNMAKRPREEEQAEDQNDSATTATSD
ncbi:Chromatin assembly factor 1 subunit A family protein [Leishmania donovani]|uniref:Chromatin assembly factor 1 subunit A family protein n=1 Tax=Leishmania donovani TaxID=5661 RepID=A0A504XE49_LEIDO|nr:Chromatin assembly factor 1 subunit A family protein [Leishmania donovani]TPP52624.1 Chromatin assembly factor 1 subunit A family protein [Leishmania donovani]